MRLRVLFAILLLAACAMAADRVKSLYKVAHISETLVGVSCPGNGGDPTVVGNYGGTLLVSCGTR